MGLPAPGTGQYTPGGSKGVSYPANPVTNPNASLPGAAPFDPNAYPTNAPATNPTPAATPPPPASTDPTANLGLLSDPGPYETWAASHLGGFDNPSNAENLYNQYGSGLMNTPSNSENLYSQGIGQLDPYYDYALKQGTRAINDAAAAHGGFSSTALYQVGNLNANLRGQQAKDMANLANQADQAKLARYGLGETEAQGADTGYLNREGAGAGVAKQWQDTQTGRLTGALSAQMGLSAGEAQQISNFYSNLGDSFKYDAESINAALQAAGIDPNSQFAKDILTVGSAIGKAYAGGLGAGK